MLQIGKKYRVVMAGDDSYFEGYALNMDANFITLTRDNEPTVLIGLAHVKYIIITDDEEYFKKYIRGGKA